MNIFTKHVKSIKGFTLVEILVVISIISTLFLFLMPQINASYIKSQESGVKSDFRTFQLAMETYMMESQGKNIKLTPFNDHLDNAHLVEVVGTMMKTNSKDPWGTPYAVEFGNRKTSFTSYGKDEKDSANNYTVATYYHDGIIDSCTTGFGTGNLKLASISDIPIGFKCGDNLSSMALPIESLPTPKNLVASSITHNKANLSWDAVSGATSYDLKRNGTIVYTGAATSYSDVSLATGTDYTYTLTAKNSSSLSSAATLKITTALVAPSEPTHLVASNVKDTSLVLNWNSVPGATSYKLSRNGTEIYTGKAGSFADSGLTFNKTYSYSLTAINDAGESPPYSISVTTKLMEVGSGDPINPYIIYNVEQLQRVDFCLTCHFELGNDIDSSSSTVWNSGDGFVPIRSRTTETFFSGELDGKNFTIHDMTINRPSEDWVGIFDYLSEDGVLKNIKIEDSTSIGKDHVGLLVAGISENATLSNIQVNGKVIGKGFVGGLTGYAEGKVTNVSSTAEVLGEVNVGGIIGESFGVATNTLFDGTVNGTGNSIGGVIGYNEGTVSHAESTGFVNGTTMVGGIIGQNHHMLTDSSSSATVTGTINEIGGLVGHHKKGNIENVVSSANVTGDADSQGVGGIIGGNHSTLMNATSTATVSGYEGVGGIIGTNIGLVHLVEFSGIIKDSQYAIGGIVGFNEGEIAETTASGSIFGTGNEVGGIAGSNIGLIDDAEFTGQAHGENDVGGLVGWNQPIGRLINSSTDSYASGTKFIGGATGRNNGLIENLTINATVEATDSNVGGLVGFNQSEIYDSTITAIVNGNDQIGGVAGDNKGIMDNVNFNGEVTGIFSVGGLVGTNEGELYNSTAQADVFGFTYIGGALGYNDTLGYIENVTTLSGSIVEATDHVGGAIGHNKGEVFNLTSHASVLGYEVVGGIFGLAEGDSTYLTSSGTVDGEISVGGIAGVNREYIIDAYSSAAVVGVSEVGGIVGSNYMLVEDSLFNGSVQGDSKVGGIIGENEWELNVSRSFGTVSGRTNVGGLVGKNNYTINNSYSFSRVTGTSDVGGLVGENTGTVRYSYAIGQVVGSSTTGGLIGLNGPSTTITNSYYNSTTSGQSDTGKGVARTTSQLKTQSTYTGWNFTTKWILNPSANNGYPDIR